MICDEWPDNPLEAEKKVASCSTLSTAKWQGGSAQAPSLTEVWDKPDLMQSASREIQATLQGKMAKEAVGMQEPASSWNREGSF